MPSNGKVDVKQGTFNSTEYDETFKIMCVLD